MGRFHASALALSFATLGCTYNRSTAENAELARRRIWTQQATRNVVFASITPGGLVDATIADSTGSAQSGERWFLDITTGRLVWKGTSESRLVADAPHAIFAEQRGNRVIVTAVEPTGTPWSRTLPGFALLSCVRAQLDVVALVTADGEVSGAPAKRSLTLTSLRVSDGTPISTALLGDATVGAGVPSGAEFTGDIAVVVAGDLLASADTAQSKVVFSWRMGWPQSGKAGLPMGVLWRRRAGGELVAAVGTGVVAVAPSGLPAWQGPVVVPGYVHALEDYRDSVVVGYRDPETHDSGLETIGSTGTPFAIHRGAPRSERASFVNGVAVRGTSALWISRGRLARADLETHQTGLSEPIPGELIRDAPAFLLARANHLDLLSLHGVQAIAYDTARPLWSVEGLRTPQETIGGLVASLSAAARVSYASHATWNSGPGVSGGQLASPVEGSGFLLAGALTKGMVLVRDSDPRRYASFVHAMDAGKLVRGVEANLALVDLDSGARQEFPLVAGNLSCAVGALLHEPTMIAFEAVEAFGLACSRGNEVHGIHVSSP